MAGEITVIGVNPLRKGKWVAHYKKLQACGCGWDRFSIEIQQKKKPTEQQVKNIVNGTEDK